MNTNTPMGSLPQQESPQPAQSIPPTQPRPKKTGKVILWIILVLVLVGAAVVAGWYVGQMNKDQAVETAKQTAKEAGIQEGKKQNDTSSSSSNTNSQEKTATGTTCNADELSMALNPTPNGGAGTFVYTFTLKNVGKRTCTLGGFPGVSLVNDNGNMIGSPAERATNYEEKKLSLAPNIEVKFEVGVPNKDNFPEGKCKEGAMKFRVYPPNDTGYLSVATDVDSWCPGLTTSPVLAM